MRTQDIVVVCVVLGIALISMAVAIRFYAPHQSKHGQHIEYAMESENASNQGKNSLSRDRSWIQVLAPNRTRAVRVPTWSCILNAGDERIYFSTLFSTVHDDAVGTPLESLYHAFRRAVHTSAVARRALIPADFRTFLSATKTWQRRSPYGLLRSRGTKQSPRSRRTSIGLADLGLRVSPTSKISTSQFLVHASDSILTQQNISQPVELFASAWTPQVQDAITHDSRMGTTLTAEEFAALSVILGVQASSAMGTDRDQPEEGRFKNGAHNVSFSVHIADKEGYHVLLTRHRRSIPQHPALGSGYSTLSAKHMAFGFLLFEWNESSLSSILITDDTWKALQCGANLELRRWSAHTQASSYLTRLPSTKPTIMHSALPNSTGPASTSVILDAIADLPFAGGLTPLASTPLMKTVRFVAAAGTSPGRLLQRLDALVAKVHVQSPALRLFGPLLDKEHTGLRLRESRRLGNVAAGAANDECLADKVARVHRYVTLLERLMFLVSSTTTSYVLSATREAVRGEISRSYKDAVAAHLQVKPEAENVSTKRDSMMPQHNPAEYCKSASAAPVLPSLPTPSSCTPNPSPRTTLANQVETLLKLPLPFDIPSVAIVARLVLVAWTLSVEPVPWEEGEVGFRIPAIESLPRTMVLW